MHVRDARGGVAQRFSETKAAASMRCAAPALTVAASRATHQPESCHASASGGVGAVQLHVRKGSRTDVLLQHDFYTFATTIATDGGGPKLTLTGHTFASPGVSLAAECLRRECFDLLVARLRATLDRAAVIARGQAGSDGPPFMTPSQLEELPSRWVMQSLDSLPDGGDSADGDGGGEWDRRLLARSHVTALDRGATATLPAETTHHPAVRWEIENVAPMSAGQYWVDLRRAADSGDGSMLGRRVDRDQVRLCPPAPTFVDAFLPSDDAFSPRGTSQCLYLAVLLAAKGTGIGRRRMQQFSRTAATIEPSPSRVQPRANESSDSSRDATATSTSAEEAAAFVATTMAEASRAARVALHERLSAHALTTDVLVETLVSGEQLDMLTLTLHRSGEERVASETAAAASPTRLPSFQLLRRSVEKLAAMYDAAARSREDEASDAIPVAALVADLFRSPSLSAPRSTVAEAAQRDAFLTRVATMLLRYQLLFGEKGYNQGPHAAIPPRIMAALHHSFDVCAEGFASPLNAHLPTFGSLFPDTDRHFGSVGSFFDVDISAGHVEVNPPFDAVVMAKMERRLLDSLAKMDTREDSLLFVVVLPSHDLDEGERTGQEQQQRPQGDHPPSSGSRKRPCEQAVKRSTDRALRESRFCLAQTLCAASESAYVDGHQHLLRSPFFCISTPTRLIVLGNTAARARYADAQSRLEVVRDAWRKMTRDELCE